MVRAGRAIRLVNGVINAGSGVVGTPQKGQRNLDRIKRGILGSLEFSRLFLREPRLSLMGDMKNGHARV